MDVGNRSFVVLPPREMNKRHVYVERPLPVAVRQRGCEGGEVESVRDSPPAGVEGIHVCRTPPNRNGKPGAYGVDVEKGSELSPRWGEGMYVCVERIPSPKEGGEKWMLKIVLGSPPEGGERETCACGRPPSRGRMPGGAVRGGGGKRSWLP